MAVIRAWTGSQWKARGYPDLSTGSSRDSLAFDLTTTFDASNTGVLPGVTRTNYNSPATADSVTISGPNASRADGEYRNLDFWGDVTIAAPNLVFRNCYFHGGTVVPSGNRGCVTLNGNGNHANAQFFDCTASAQSPSYYRDGWVGNNYTATRCRAFNVNDGFGAFSVPGGPGDCNVELYGCYSHDLVFWSQDPAHSDGTHNDGIQYQGGTHFRAIACHVIGRNVDATGSVSANPKNPYTNGNGIVINQNTAPASDVLIDQCQFEMCAVQLNLNRGSTYASLNVSLGANKYGRDIYNHYAPNPDYRWITMGTTGTYNITGLYDQQRFADTNALLTVGRTSGIRVV